MRRATKEWLESLEERDSKYTEPDGFARDILDSDRRQAAEIRALKAAARDAVTEFKRRGQSPWAACAALESALKPAKRRKP